MGCEGAASCVGNGADLDGSGCAETRRANSPSRSFMGFLNTMQRKGIPQNPQPPKSAGGLCSSSQTWTNADRLQAMAIATGRRQPTYRQSSRQPAARFGGGDLICTQSSLSTHSYASDSSRNTTFVTYM